MQHDDTLWFKQFATSNEFKFLKDHPIVYFCAEYAINDVIPTYAGGLGILAGDIIREAASQDIPLIAVGLYYHEGYLYHDLDKEGVVIKTQPLIDPSDVELTPVVDRQNNRIVVAIPIQDSLVSIQAWSLEIGSVKIYLLDTRIQENAEGDRRITDRLYVASKEVRFKQELVLGLGGLRLLQALKIEPIGYHLNDGHSALLALEIAKYEMKKHQHTLQEELDNTRRHIFFTNHTLVAAGNDTYNADLASVLLSGFAKELEVPVNDIVRLGLVADSSIFSMTLLALRMASKVNAVSKIHAEKAKEIWSDHPMIPITNGIHIKTWDKLSGNENIWEKHQENKRALLKYIHDATGVTWGEDALLLGWARRIVGYKRPLALFEKLQEFKKIADSSDRPIHVVLSGLSHENDLEGEVILKQIRKIVTEDLKGSVVYLPGYRMLIAQLMVAGCDVWLNTPIVGFEACGTSGMKAALNGVLPCSTADGWVAEAELFKLGWLLQNENLGEDIISILTREIVPLYYNRDVNRVPQEWLKMMENARDMALNQFNATLMFKKYIEEFYLPVIRTHELKNSQPVASS